MSHEFKKKNRGGDNFKVRRPQESFFWIENLYGFVFSGCLCIHVYMYVCVWCMYMKVSKVGWTKFSMDKVLDVCVSACCYVCVYMGPSSVLQIFLAATVANMCAKMTDDQSAEIISSVITCNYPTGVDFPSFCESCCRLQCLCKSRSLAQQRENKHRTRVAGAGALHFLHRTPSTRELVDTWILWEVFRTWKETWALTPSLCCRLSCLAYNNQL